MTWSFSNLLGDLGREIRSQPFLFILSMEILSKLLTNVGKSGFDFSKDVNVELSRESLGILFFWQGERRSQSASWWTIFKVS